MKKINIFAILLALIFSNASHAMDLSFNNAVDKIITESNDLKSADANVKQAQAGLDAANANRWFKIEGSTTYMNLVNVEKPLSGNGVELPIEMGGLVSGLTDGAVSNVEFPDNIFMAGATITQPIYTFGKIGNAVAGVRSAIEMAQFGKDITKREVEYAAANLYWTAKMTDALVDVAKSSLNNAVSANKKLTSTGRANRANLIKIQADIAKKEIDLSDAEFNRDTAHRMLKIMAGIDINEELNLTDGIPKNFESINFNDIKSNPNWDMLNVKAQMYEKKAAGERAGHYPTLAAVGAYNYVASNTDMDMFSGNKQQVGYWGLSLKIPIFDGGLSRANSTMQAMQAESIRQDLDKSKKLKTEEYNTAIRKYEHFLVNLKNLDNARNLAEKSYKISQDRFTSGQTSAVELSEVSDSLSGLDMAVLNAKYNLLMAIETVKKLGE